MDYIGHDTSTAWFDPKFNRKCVKNSEEQSLLLPMTNMATDVIAKREVIFSR